MHSSIIGAILLVIVGAIQAQVVYPDQLVGLNALDRQLALQNNLVAGGGRRMVRNQLRRQQQLLEQQAVNNAVVSQQLRRQGLRQAGLGGVVNVVRPVGGLVGGVVGGDYGVGLGATAGLTGLPACCLRTDQTACLAVSPLSSYAAGSTCQRWYYDALTRQCRQATFNTVCADGRGFSNYFKSEGLCYAKCGAGALAATTY